jgi:probable HAF family extracellular repeat protein
MKTQKTILCATLVLLFVLAGPVSAAYYNVIDLGTLPGGGNSNAESINGNGSQIVGNAYDSSGNLHSCLFDSPNRDLGSLGYNESVTCYSVNNNCQIVGGAHLAYGFTSRACLFDPTGGGANINLGILPGYQQSNAYSINNKGQIVGLSTNYGPGWASYSHACIFYATGGSPTDLGALGSNVPYSEAMSINDQGQIVGWAGHGTDRIACLFDATGAGNNIDLGGLGGNYSLAYSNNDGQIVGVATNSSGYSRACIFDPTGGGANIALETVVGFDNAGAWFINNHAQIVGSAWNSSGNSHAWLFNPMTGDMMDLNTLIDPASNWVLTNATCISNNGWIVGDGINPDGETHAFLLTPEPATVVMMGLGGLALLRKRRA